MQLDSPKLGFPATFCCNCGATNCMTEIQDSRVVRYFGIGGTETRFQLPVPVCARCRRSTRRRPMGFFAQLLVLGLAVAVFFLAFAMIASMVSLPLWLGDHLFGISVGFAAVLVFFVFRLRRPKPPMTSFYQPVRIREVRVQVTDVMQGYGHVAFMKLAFTNPDYLLAFVNANRDAIVAGHLAAVKA
jgi:hypothetical protein